MGQRPVLEVCLDSVEAAVAAQEGGADRVELCSALLDGGLTPSPGLLRQVRRRVSIGVMAMLRIRGGDFCFSAAELDAMRDDLEMLKAEGVNGIVLGFLQPEGTVDAGLVEEFVARARPLPVTFHRAFDMTRDPFEALEALVALGVSRVLTSGQEATVLSGVPLLAELVRRAGERIVVMPGGPVTEEEIAVIARETGAKELHFACFDEVESPMRFRNPRVYMGAALPTSEYARGVVRADRVRRFVEAAGERPGREDRRRQDQHREDQGREGRKPGRPSTPA